jgi:hypothetical protein
MDAKSFKMHGIGEHTGLRSVMTTITSDSRTIKHDRRRKTERIQDPTLGMEVYYFNILAE